MRCEVTKKGGLVKLSIDVGGKVSTFFYPVDMLDEVRFLADVINELSDIENIVTFSVVPDQVVFYTSEGSVLAFLGADPGLVARLVEVCDDLVALGGVGPIMVTKDNEVLVHVSGEVVGLDEWVEHALECVDEVLYGGKMVVLPGHTIRVTEKDAVRLRELIRKLVDWGVVSVGFERESDRE